MKRNENIEFGTTPTYPRPPKPGSKASVNNQNEYKVSIKWDMNISLEELINYNETCKIDLDSTHNFDTYDGILIYVSYPQKDEKFTKVSVRENEVADRFHARPEEWQRI